MEDEDESDDDKVGLRMPLQRKAFSWSVEWNMKIRLFKNFLFGKKVCCVVPVYFLFISHFKVKGKMRTLISLKRRKFSKGQRPGQAS